jgi:hypothetical protein
LLRVENKRSSKLLLAKTKKLTDEAVSDHITFGGNSSRTFWPLGIARPQGGSGSSVSIVPPAQSMDAAPPASPPTLLGGGGRDPASASRADAQRHRETRRARNEGPAPSPCLRANQGPCAVGGGGTAASSSSAVPSLPPLSASASAPHHIHVLASLPPSSLLHRSRCRHAARAPLSPASRAATLSLPWISGCGC